MGKKNKLIRITTVPISLRVLLRHQLKFMSRHFDVLAVSSPDKELEQVAKQESVRTESVQMTRSITPVQDLKSLWKLYRLFKKEKPAIVHTHTPKAGLLGMMASKFAGVPVRLHTVAGLPLMETFGTKRRILEYVERVTYKSATRVYPNSKNLATFILNNRYCKSDKLKVLGNGSSNGIDTDYFQLHNEIASIADKLKKELFIKETDFVFVFIGRLVKDKGIEELVEAFINLKQKNANIKLLLVGPYEPDLDPIKAEVVKRIEEDADIIHVGFQQDVRPYYAISHALAFPSYREGFPNVPMQAGCFHLPSIVTDINGCNEIVKENVNGLIIPAKNVSALEHAMDALLTNKELYLQMKSIARKMIVERFDQKYLWSLILQEYEDQLKSNVVS